MFFIAVLNDSAKVAFDAQSRKMSFTTGILGGYNVIGGLYIETGLLYSNKGTMHWNFGDAESNSGNTVSYHLEGKHLELPLKIRYEYARKSFTWYASFGTHLKFNISANKSMYDYYDYENMLHYSISPKTKSLGTTLAVNTGLEFNVNPNISFFIEPEFRYSFTPMLQVKDHTVLPINPRQHSFGFGAGVSYKFLKK